MEIDLEDEDPSFGMRSTADLSWKMVLDTYSCTECWSLHCVLPDGSDG